MTHDLELEKRVICLCHSLQKTPPDLSDKHFYNTHMAKIYSEIRAGNPLQTDVDFEKGGIDVGALYECLEVGAFSELEMPSNAMKLIGLYNKREKIKEAEIALESIKRADIELCVDKQDGFEELMNEHEEIGSGVFELLETPWYRLTHDSRFTEGKAITIICGDPGVGKSFFTTHLFMDFAVQGIKAILWGAEDNARFHTRRAIAQYMGNGNLCDYEFIRRNHTFVKQVYNENKDVIDKIMQTLYTSDNLNKEELTKWCWDKAKQGYQVIGIDPITFFSGGDKAHVADQKIMEELNTIRKTHGTRFIIITHPRESSGSVISQDGMAGGRAVSRFAQNILWITEASEADAPANRKIYTLKSRNGKREFGGKILFNFSRETARFEEIET